MRSICRRLSLGIVVSICMAFNAANASDVDRSVYWLKETPVSLWVYGQMRLSQHFSGWSDEPPYSPLSNLFGMINTSAIDDHIQINAIDINRDFTEERCAKILEAIRNDAYVREGEVPEEWGSSFYSTFFINHTAAGPRDYLKHIDEVISIRVALNGGACKGPLVSTEVEYEEF